MALTDTQYSIGDYSLFENANQTTKDLISKEGTQLSTIKSCKETLSNGEVFQGTIADNCKEAIDNINEKIASSNANFTSFSTALTQIVSVYKSGDTSALSQLLNIDESTLNSTLLGTSDMTSGTVEGQSYFVTDTKGGALNFAKHIDKDKVSEAKDPSQYNGQCLGFAFMNCWGLYTNNRNYTAKDGRAYRGQSNFSEYESESKEEFLKQIYSQLNQNKPVVVQVNGNRKGTSRHYVTVIGYKKSVKSASELTEKDLLIIDPYDGKTKTMDKANSRFLVTGKQCGKKRYSGYQMYYIT